jgi:hypothetical protein
MMSAIKIKTVRALVYVSPAPPWVPGLRSRLSPPACRDSYSICHRWLWTVPALSRQHYGIA